MEREPYYITELRRSVERFRAGPNWAFTMAQNELNIALELEASLIVKQSPAGATGSSTDDPKKPGSSAADPETIKEN